MSDDFAFMTALEMRQLIRDKPGVAGRDREKHAAAYRGVAAGAQCLRHRDARPCAGGGARGREGGHGGRGRRPAHRDAAVDQGPDRRQRRPLHVRLAHARQFHRAGRLAGLRAREGAWRAIVGKTTTTEFGCKGSSNSPLTGDTRNPWNLAKTTGGSSAGAGASVAAGLTPFALGTDGGGSIRIPSSLLRPVRHQGAFRARARLPGRGDADARPCRSAGAHRARCGACCSPRSPASMRAIRPASPADVRTISAPANEPPRACASPGARRSAMRGPRAKWRRLPARPAQVFEELGCTRRTGREGVRRPDRSLDGRVLCRGRHAAQEDPHRAARAASIRPSPTCSTTRSIRPIDEYYGRVFARYEFREKMRQFFEQFDLLMTPTTPTVGVRPRPRRSRRARWRQHRLVGRLHLSDQSLRLARRIDPLRLYARPACPSACTSWPGASARRTSSAPRRPSRPRTRGQTRDRHRQAAR